MKQTNSVFEPMRVPEIPPAEFGPARVTVTGTLKGAAATEFEELRSRFGLNRSQLVLQMVYHCLGRSGELKDLYRRIAIMGK